MFDWQHIKPFFDGFSATAIVGALLGLLPAIAAVFGMVYYVVQIYESATFQRIVKRLRGWHAHRRRVKLLIQRENINAALNYLDSIKDSAKHKD